MTEFCVGVGFGLLGVGVRGLRGEPAAAADKVDTDDGESGLVGERGGLGTILERGGVLGALPVISV